MLISHTKRFIFIHNYKVAGTSVKNALKPYRYNYYKGPLLSKITDRLTGRYRTSVKFFPEDHLKSSEVRKRMPSKFFQSYFKFGFVRNPYDWQVSLFHYMIKKRNHHQHEFISSMEDFKQYINWRVKSEVVLQQSFFYENGNRLVDFIGKFENLSKDFDYITDHLDLDASLAHLNKTEKSKPYMDYYDEESIRLINDAYRNDFETFDYKML